MTSPNSSYLSQLFFNCWYLFCFLFLPSVLQSIQVALVPQCRNRGWVKLIRHHAETTSFRSSHKFSSSNNYENASHLASHIYSPLQRSGLSAAGRRCDFSFTQAFFVCMSSCWVNLQTSRHKFSSSSTAALLAAVTQRGILARELAGHFYQVFVFSCCQPFLFFSVACH